ncbi:hypothetical protein OUS_0318 [Helicobacter pylori R056a]|uniref:Uncharacterized protein n=1 Tax=Helicobacter pylori R018c TaxID=1145110 RepID=K2K5J2_HELPX|nr:hypothetical protein OUC_0232 [Helicobacter pylori R018c]EKE96249.1 hypothetical protein OUS_0318 [Helicobacter pylori R056a]
MRKLTTKGFYESFMVGATKKAGLILMIKKRLRLRAKRTPNPF